MGIDYRDGGGIISVSHHMFTPKSPLVPLVVAMACIALSACASNTRVFMTSPPCSPSIGAGFAALARAKGIDVKLPSSASGPHYDLENNGPSWSGSNWKFNALLGNGGILQYTHDGHYCALDDSEMKRKVYVGEWISHYGAYANIWHVSTPDKISTVAVSIEPNGLSEAEALSIIATTVTTWEHPQGRSGGG